MGQLAWQFGMLEGVADAAVVGEVTEAARIVLPIIPLDDVAGAPK